MELSVDQFRLRSPESFSVEEKKSFDEDSADSATRIEKDFNINEESCIHAVQNLCARNLIFEYSGNIETSPLEEEEDEHREAIHDPYIRKLSYNFSPDLTVQDVGPLASDRKNYEWQQQDVVLSSVIKKSGFHYIWSAENRVLNEQCTVQIILKDHTKLINNDFSKTKAILEKLKAATEMQDVMKLYCFSVSEEEDFLVIILVHEPIHFTLQEYFNFRLKREDFIESEILQVLGEIQCGFEAYMEQGIWMDDFSLENIFISKNNYSIKLNGFALELPLIEQNKELHMKFADKNVQRSKEEFYVKSVSMLAFQLITMNKDTNFPVNKIEKDISYQTKYCILMYLLGLRWDTKDFQETLRSIYTRNTERKYKSIEEMREYYHLKMQENSYFEMIKRKDEGYQYLQNSGESLETLEKTKQILQKKEGKTKIEYYQYLICVNRLLVHYIKLENVKKIFEIKSEINRLSKTNEMFNKVKAMCHLDFAEHIFLIGQVQQQFLKNINQAKKTYEEGIVYCRQNQVIENHVYCNALKNMIKICQDDFEILRYSEYLKNFYSQKEGRYLEKAQLYRGMGMILARQGNYGRALKHYISSFDMYQKRMITKKEVFIEVLEEIIEACENLKEDDVVIKYLEKCKELKKEVYGEVSREYANILKRTSEVHLRNQRYDFALEHYLNYLALVEKLSGICSDKYANALLILSEIYLGMDNYEKALETYDEYVSLCPEWNQSQGTKSFVLMDKMANVLFKKEDFRGSLKVQLQSLSIKEMIFGKMSKYYFVSLNNIGDMYFGGGQFVKALEYHLRCFNIIKCDTKNAKNSDYVQVLLNIAYDYERMENYGKAVEYLYQSLQLNSTRGGLLEIESIVDEYEALNTLKKKRLITLNFDNIVIQTNMSFN